MKRVQRFALLLTLLVLALGLMSSLAVNVILFRQVRQYYEEVNATRLDPFGLQSFEGTPAPAAMPGTRRVVFVGDSRALGWDAPPLAGHEFLNRGVSAQTTMQVLGRFAQDVAPLAPDVVVLQVGINDLKTLPLFPNDADAILAQCKANLRSIVEAAQALGAHVILTTIFPTGPVPLERRIFWSDAVDPAVLAVNDELRAMAEPNIRVLDAYAALADEDGQMQAEFALDFLHLNEAGYAVLNRLLVEALAEAE